MKQVLKYGLSSLVIAIGFFVVLGGILTSCSSPTGTRKLGEGMTFREAADKAVAEQTAPSISNPFGYSQPGMIVKFYWDDGSGNPKLGWVTVSGTNSWYVAPWQCSYAPPEACAYGEINESVYSDEAYTAATAGKDCWLWPKRCFIVGYYYDPNSSCFGHWCPKIECQTGCPPGYTGN
jgi:hypothetical protein